MWGLCSHHWAQQKGDFNLYSKCGGPYTKTQKSHGALSKAAAQATTHRLSRAELCKSHVPKPMSMRSMSRSAGKGERGQVPLDIAARLAG